jgi:Flp pilus assembly protein TadG
MILLATRVRKKPGRHGVAAAELAMMLPVLMLLLVLAVDFARVFYYYVILTNCAGNAASWAALPAIEQAQSFASLDDAAQADWPSSVTPLPTASETTGTDSEGNAYVAVTLNWTFNTITGYLGGSGTVDLSRTVRARVQPITPNTGP